MPGTELIIERLPNGLTILLQPMHTAPILAQGIWYRVGARNDPPGRTGLSHWVEHMLFRGTPQYPAAQVERQIARCGGQWNASTSLDWTVYYEIVPSAHADLLIPLEADRMVNARFEAQDVEAERQVILTERLQRLDSPSYRLSRRVLRAALPQHPYGNPVIGEAEDLMAASRADLYEHYRAWYTPANAVLVWCGDFDPDTVLPLLREHFAPLPAVAPPEAPPPAEGSPLTPDFIVEEGAGHNTYLLAVYRAPQALHPDFIPFVVTESLLNGATSMLGGSLSNRTSRLYRRLIEGEYILNFSGGLTATMEPYLYTFSATLHPQRAPQEVLAALDAEISRLQDTPPPEDELQRAIKQARALAAYSSESISGRSAWLGFEQVLAGGRWRDTYLEALAAVTPQQVQRIAQKYLRPEQRVTGIYRPAE